ncbi:carbon-nitrogen hydrolase family protein [Streptomyces sp. LX-29]|uniref:carbon-nitrogen hydrolase family protein n=1 Tax=Streptomyces sp. LX-29 TaxID=2900152 RepID=UPI00240DFE95|nr:carbon-nitrogen hydrolase family protein [Streptomyces sp. LX-29]WFB09745.1 carbon-nitrogen hydrolase family protein [Streptomyces sp. LX-29]
MIIATVQSTPVPCDVAANAERIAGVIEEAAGRGAELVVFPELELTGYALSAIAAAPERLAVTAEGDPRLEPVVRACRAAQVAAVVNCAVRTGGTDGPLTITSLVIGPDGEPLTRYDKLKLHGEEGGVFTAGCRDGRFAYRGVDFALAVCYDSRFPEIAKRAAADGCQVYLASAVHDPESDVGRGQPHYPGLARDNGLWVVLANAVGPTGPLIGCGLAGAWGPDGASLAEGSGTDPEVVLVELPVGGASPLGSGASAPVTG